MDKVVIITGASGGIGSVAALKFGAEGGRVVLADKATEKASEIAAEINRGPGQAIVCQADVRDFGQIEGMVKTTLEKWRRIDVLLCLAGQFLRHLRGNTEEKRLIDHTEEDWDLVLDTNLKGTFYCMKAVIPQMMAQKQGHIVIMSAGTGLRGKAFQSAYAASKAGLFGLMKSAAWELGPYNVQVNAICPGLTVHPSLKPFGSDVDFYTGEAALHRYGGPDEVAKFMVHLTGMQNISGQILNIDSRILF